MGIWLCDRYDIYLIGAFGNYFNRDAVCEREDRCRNNKIMVVISLRMCVFCRMTETITRNVFHRLGGASNRWYRHQPSAPHGPRKICKFWMSGSCTKNSCAFFHPDKAAPTNSVLLENSLKSKQSYGPLKPLRSITKRVNVEQNLWSWKQNSSIENAVDKKPFVKRNNFSDQQLSLKHSNNVGNIDKPSFKHNDGGPQKLSPVIQDGGAEKKHHKICEDWINKSCVSGEKCKYLHSWSSGISKMVQLEGHQKAATGINLPSSSDKLFTSSKNETVRIWKCDTGECLVVADMGAPVGCLISEGPWVFAGLTNAIKAWKIESNIELTLDAPAGRVFSLAVCDGTLFAGLQDGSIFVWKLNSHANAFEALSSLKEHTGAVVSLFYGAKRLYSGSTDNTVRVWELENMCCIHMLQKHSDAIMSLVCWDQYLLSSSLDKTLKVWAATQAGELEVVYTHNEEHGILSLCGMHDTTGKPVLLCSCNDNTIVCISTTCPHLSREAAYSQNKKSEHSILVREACSSPVTELARYLCGEERASRIL